MKVLIFSGNHTRHLFINKVILELGLEACAVIMQREDLLPEPPVNISRDQQKLFNWHFHERYKIEANAFGSLNPQDVFKLIPTHYTTSKDLNSLETVNFVKYHKPDFAFIFGTDLIRGELLKILPYDKINLHLGLSPWYRGSATLFWPFYFLQPQYAGITFHQITAEADAGGIIHQACPVLNKGDGIHDVGVKCVLTAKDQLVLLLKKYQINQNFTYHMQKSTGRLFLTKDFHPSHLKLIYELYDNKIVDHYLNNNLSSDVPKIINAL